MTLKKTVFDAATGETTEVDFTHAEIAAHEAFVATQVTEQAAESARQAKLSGARPPNAILVKLRDGVDLTPAEMQRVLRYLALREFREARG